MTSLLWKFCHYGSAEARDEAYQEILERGEAILPELIQAVEEELQRVRGSFGGTDEQGQVIYPGPEPLERLIKLLVTYDSPSILFSLAWVAAWRYEKTFQELFFRVYTAFEARASSDDIAAFISTLKKLRALRGD